MATRQVQVTDVWELIILMAHKAGIIESCLRSCPEPNRLPISDLGKEIARMADLHLALKEAVAALPKPLQLAEGSKRAS